MLELGFIRMKRITGMKISSEISCNPSNHLHPTTIPVRFVKDRFPFHNITKNPDNISDRANFHSSQIVTEGKFSSNFAGSLNIIS